ncbi:MAG TPA: BamA/TamA family outer membrane protein [Gemmatimonadota bacterium]|nr:BamA/TamA family outer membrane protein [Gemmatimonadota bacterium]
MTRALVLSLLLGLVLPALAPAQYFGRNKVRYEDFDFQVLESEHFDIYHYDRTSGQAVAGAARMAETWYARFARLFDHRFEERKPLVLYADKPDFQQTNTTPGFISQGTGGFTESLKDRVVMPLAETYRETNHVLGHELVHAFQFDLAQSETGGGSTAFRRLPLWFIEGLAEYLTLGRTDVHTAMWMRDAVLRDEIPTLKELSRDPRYFPYRYGHAFWAFVGGRYGDSIVPSLYRAAGQAGIEAAIESVLRTSPDSLSQAWIRANRDHFGPLARGRTPPGQEGEPLLAPGEVGDDDWTLAPVLSPDGSRVVFLSQLELFSIDLFVADAVTGEIIGKLAETLRSPHFDAIAFLGSSGTWSPDGRRFAFVTYAEGDNEIAIADVESRDVVQTLPLPGVGAIYDLAWSPDGRSIAVSGGAGAITDLFLVDIASGQVERLTEGPEAELQPAWSPDGSTISFTTDRGETTELDRLRFGEMGLGFLDLASREVRTARPLGDAKHINPQYGPDGESLFFVSDRGGTSDVYRLDLASGQAFQVTRVATGVSGITGLSPAMSVARETGRLAFAVFHDRGYRGYTLPVGETQGEPVAGDGPDLAGVLPPVNASEPALVARYLEEPAAAPSRSPALATRPYDPDLSLDFVAPPTAGVGIDRFGASIGGSIGFFFSDMLSDRQVGLGVQANGGLKDLGGELIYVNKEGRVSWGGRVGHVTYRTAFGRVIPATIDGVPGRVIEIELARTFFTGGSVIAAYPFSLTRRIEGDLGFTRVAFDREVERSLVIGNAIVDQEREDLEAGDALNLGHGSAAWVEDFSVFGFTSPVRGGRSRFEVGGNAGTLSFANVLADFRRYLFARPVTLAVRAFHLGRYAGDAESDRLTPLFVGFPSLIRGYEAGSFEPEECSVVPEEPAACPEFDRLIGSRIGVANVELRVPVFGTEDFGLLGGGFFPTELALFADGGAAWTSEESPELAFETESIERIPVFSAGGTLRFNLFGSIVAEVYYAYPFQRPEEGWRWGFQLAPGW